MLSFTGNTNRTITGNSGLIIAVILMAVMALSALVAMPAEHLAGDFGICFPSPNNMNLSPLTAWIVNSGALLLTALTALIVNNEFKVIKSNTTLHASTFLIISGANPWLVLSDALPALTAFATIVCTIILFSQYGKRNASAAITMLFSVLSVGSMFQYAYLLLMPIFLLGASFLNILRFKEFVAAILGIIAPYWIVIGFGIVGIDDFKLPTLSNLFLNFTAPADLLWLLVSVAFTGITGIILTLNNLSKIFATDNRSRSYNSFLVLLECALLWFIIFDYTNLLSYVATFNLATCFQIASFISLSRNRRTHLLPTVIAAVFIAIFIIIIYG